VHEHLLAAAVPTPSTPARWQMPALRRCPRAENLSRLLSAAAAATSSKMPIAVA
jgi:hypothetical protein